MTISPEDFKPLEEQYRKIKEDYADARLSFYEDNFEKKRRRAEGSKVALLVFSLLIPIIINLGNIPYIKGIKVNFDFIALIVTILSLFIAFITSLGEIRQWQRLWKEYSKARVLIDGLIASWEIEVNKARLLSSPGEVSENLSKATNTLLKSVEQIVLTEMMAFFAAAEKTQAETIPSHPPIGKG